MSDRRALANAIEDAGIPPGQHHHQPAQPQHERHRRRDVPILPSSTTRRQVQRENAIMLDVFLLAILAGLLIGGGVVWWLEL
jgi:hypothetical protein